MRRVTSHASSTDGRFFHHFSHLKAKRLVGTGSPRVNANRLDVSSGTEAETEANSGISDEEALETRIERLGRERPPSFPTARSEVAFVFPIMMSQNMTEYFVSGFNVIIPTLIVELDIPESSSVWPASAFSLVIASTLLVFGRLGDMYGGFVVYVSGLA